jgi:hypothetical protein
VRHPAWGTSGQMNWEFPPSPFQNDILNMRLTMANPRATS